MELKNDFTIGAGVERAWPVLTDLERVVPCLPGATLNSVDGNAFTGGMKIKVGPMSLTYKGEGKVSPNEQARSILVEASGSEQRGGGSAAATITAVLEPLSADTTRVRVTTELALSGKPAQFGRGIMVEVAGRILGTFATNLEQALHNTSAEDDVPVAAGVSDVLDLSEVGLAPLLKRVIPVLGGAVVVGLAVRHLLRHRRS